MLPLSGQGQGVCPLVLVWFFGLFCVTEELSPCLSEGPGEVVASSGYSAAHKNFPAACPSLASLPSGDCFTKPLHPPKIGRGEILQLYCVGLNAGLPC